MRRTRALLRVMVQAVEGAIKGVAFNANLYRLYGIQGYEPEAKRYDDLSEAMGLLKYVLMNDWLVKALAIARERMNGMTVKNGVLYMAFTRDTSDEQARAAFVAKYGKEPEMIGKYKGLVMAGPAPVEYEQEITE